MVTAQGTITSRGDMQLIWYKISKVSMDFSLEFGEAWVLGIGWVNDSQVFTEVSSKAASWPYWSSSTWCHMPETTLLQRLSHSCVVLSNFGLWWKALGSSQWHALSHCQTPPFYLDFLAQFQVFTVRKVLLHAQCPCHFWGHYAGLVLFSPQDSSVSSQDNYSHLLPMAYQWLNHCLGRVTFTFSYDRTLPSTHDFKLGSWLWMS